MPLFNFDSFLERVITMQRNTNTVHLLHVFIHGFVYGHLSKRQHLHDRVLR